MCVRMHVRLLNKVYTNAKKGAVNDGYIHVTTSSSTSNTLVILSNSPSMLALRAFEIALVTSLLGTDLHIDKVIHFQLSI